MFAILPRTQPDWSVAVGAGRLAELDDADAGRAPRRAPAANGSPQSASTITVAAAAARRRR